MTNLAAIKFFVTPTHRCSYLPEQDATTLFADPKTEVDRDLYSELSEMGFRRSGNYLYRPHCKLCSACIPVRIPVDQFKHSRKHRRVWRRNADLTVSQRNASYSDEHYKLYEKYISQVHGDGDMYPPSMEQYQSFLLSDWSNTIFTEFRLEGELVCVAVTDLMDNGLSAVYTYYNPDLMKRSLGVYAVLWQIEDTKKRALPAVYLGYWIKQCPKMKYKKEFKPLEMFINNRWESLVP